MYSIPSSNLYLFVHVQIHSQGAAPPQLFQSNHQFSEGTLIIKIYHNLNYSKPGWFAQRWSDCKWIHQTIISISCRLFFLFFCDEKLYRCWWRCTISQGWIEAILKIAFFPCTVRYCVFIPAAPEVVGSKNPVYCLPFPTEPCDPCGMRCGREDSPLGNWLPLPGYYQGEPSRICWDKSPCKVKAIVPQHKQRRCFISDQ